MTEKLKNAGVVFTNFVEKGVNLVITPPVKGIDWLASKWLSHEIEDKDSFIDFLESSLAEQRTSLLRYIRENEEMAKRLAKYEKHGEENLIKQTEWLSKEASRINSLLHEQMENNEKLNTINAKMRTAGDALAEAVANNKPKKYVSKKDKQIQKAIQTWNSNSR